MLAAWLQTNLPGRHFDVGVFPNGVANYTKIHELTDLDQLKKFKGIRIRIRQDRKKLATALYLFLVKNVYNMIPTFSRNQTDLETFTKVYSCQRQWFIDDGNLDYQLYDYVVDFSALYDQEFMIRLYQTINNQAPSDWLVRQLIENNYQNDPKLDAYHSCHIAAKVLNVEHALNLNEQDRNWSIVDLYSNFDLESRSTMLESFLTPKNYRNRQ